tara:strand:+ start:3961 stop:4725 length:765 start_codon:yes stop_codon:yes gene_type:complete
MNKLIIILTTGAYIPWTIMLFIYLVNYKMFDFLSTLLYLLFASMKWSHMEHGKMNVVFWNRVFVITEMALFVRLMILNLFGSGILSFVVMAALWWFTFKLPQQLQKIITEAPIYCVCLLFLMSSSRSTVQHLASVLLISISIYLWKKDLQFVNIHQMKRKLMIIYGVKIIEAYMVFMLEWASSKMHVFSLVILFAFPIAYSLWGYYSVEIEEDNLSEYMYNMNKLPVGYPLPLNFKHAVTHCNIAKSLFKDHRL